MDLPIRAVKAVSSAHDNIMSSEEFVKLADAIFDWGLARGITLANGATPQSQLAKLEEEFDELRVGIETQDYDLIADSIGDMYVVLQQVARLSGIPMQECLEVAWEDIKDRKGYMIHGVFVKQRDIDMVGLDKLRATSDAAGLRELIEQTNRKE